MKFLLTILLLLVIKANCVAGFENITADTVQSLHPGTGQNSGQGPAFFPKNVFGLPDPRATDSTPVTDPRSICSIGLNGEIVIGFREHVIVDGPGADFTVFENPFHYGAGRLYAEPASVSISKDGETWFTLPFDSSTLVGCAGVTPATGEDPFNPDVSGGDSFDLSTVGVDSVRWIKLSDITSTILNNPQHPYYDPTLSGFDLDAVTSRYGVRAPLHQALVLYPHSTTVEVHVVSGSATLYVHDVRGIELSREEVQPGVHVRDFSSYVNTCLLVSLRSAHATSTIKVLQ